MDNFLLVSDLPKKSQELLDKVLNVDESKFNGIKDIIVRNAVEKGLPSKEITLRDAQVRPVIMSYVNPRFFIGDKPGLGKTVMSAGCYAYYQMQCRKKGITPGRVLVVTESSHVVGFAKEWEQYGIKLLPLTKSSLGIARAYRNNDYREYDGEIINWDGLKTNGFLEHYLEHADEYGYAVFDETSKLLNPKASMYSITNNIVNKYAGGIPRVVFLNGSSFEKNIFDFYYQFGILKPGLIPTKSFLEERYVVRGGKNIFMKDLVNRGGSMQIETVQRRVGEIVDYQNQEELRERLKYYYIARSKEDYGGEIPKHSYILHGVEMTGRQAKILEDQQNISLINSPRTSDPDAKFTFTTSPKLKAVVEFADTVADDRPIVYVYNKDSQKVVADELRKLGYRVGTLNGDTGSAEVKNEVVDSFNNGELDMLVFNVEKAINLPSSDRVIFYDIPTMPQRTNQVKGRIDRDNYDTKKFYDFFCYLESPEMINIIRLAYFREHHGNMFTGQVENVYGMLVNQLRIIYTEGAIDDIEEKVTVMQEQGLDFEAIRDEIAELLDI